MEDLPPYLKPMHELLLRSMTDDPSLTKTELYTIFANNYPDYPLCFGDGLHIDCHLFGERSRRRWRRAFNFPENENDPVMLDCEPVGHARNVGVFTFDLVLPSLD